MGRVEKYCANFLHLLFRSWEGAEKFFAGIIKQGRDWFGQKISKWNFPSRSLQAEQYNWEGKREGLWRVEKICGNASKQTKHCIANQIHFWIWPMGHKECGESNESDPTNIKMSYWAFVYWPFLGSTLCKKPCTRCAVCIVRWKMGVEMQIAQYIVHAAKAKALCNQRHTWQVAVMEDWKPRAGYCPLLSILCNMYNFICIMCMIRTHALRICYLYYVHYVFCIAQCTM